MSKASLRLFNVVPKEDNNSYKSSEDFKILIEHGLLVEKDALNHLDEIKEFIREENLSGRELNKSFHKSWSKVAEASEEELIEEQIIHYLSTYGLEYLGCYSSDTIYIPEEELEIPVSFTLKVIKALSKGILISRVFKLLQSGAALKQDTITDLLAILNECDYTFTGNEDIHNKEAQSLIADLTGILPHGENLLRYCVYKATSSTLLIKNNITIITIKQSGFILPSECWKEIELLARSFNRYKPLWLAFKSACEDNKYFVNRLSKLSKKYHKPMPVDILGSLTYGEYSLEEVKLVAQDAITPKIVKAINALRLYQTDTANMFYSIRNGKGWAVNRPDKTVNTSKLKEYEECLLEILSKRILVKDVYQPPHINYAIPTSQKQFVGNIPIGTQISVPKTEDLFLIGVYWEGELVDLDLSALSEDYNIGWNSNYRNTDRTLMYSGDVTSAPGGATEWLYCSKLDSSYLIKLNLYNGEIGHPFKLIFGYAKCNTLRKNYIIDPNKVLFSFDCQMNQRELVLGLLEPDNTNFYFTIYGQGSGECSVSSKNGLSNVVRKHQYNSSNSKLKINDLFVINSFTDDLTVDLSPDKIDIDSISALFSP